MQRDLTLDGKNYTVVVIDTPAGCTAQIDNGPATPVALETKNTGLSTLRSESKEYTIELACDGDRVFVKAFGRHWQVRVLDPVECAGALRAARGNIATAPMPGVIVDIHARPGQPVRRGAPLITIESMKMLTVISAWRDGIIATLHYDIGDNFDKGSRLVTFVAVEGPEHA